MNLKEITELKQKRAALLADANSIHAKTVAEKRALNTEEQSRYDAIMVDFEKIGDTAKRSEQLLAAQSRLDAIDTRDLSADVGSREVAGGGDVATKSAAKRAAFNKFLAGGVADLNEVERRDLAADSAVAGGNMVVPQEFVSELLLDLRNMVFIRQLARTFKLGAAANLGIPQLTAEVADSDWTTEVASVAVDTAQQFGKRTLTPTMLTKAAKVSLKLLQVGALPAEQIVRDSLNYKFAVSMEKAYMTGSGSSQPLGLFTASASGISTGRDVATANTTTAITADNLFNVQMSVKAQYRKLKSCGWIFHRDAVRNVRLLKDTQNRYLFEASLQPNEPDRLLGAPIYETEYAPNTFTTGLYVGLYGAMEYYWIADQLDFSVQRLVELYAANNQVGFIGRLNTDGAPAMEAAFARVKLA